jgi:hypothetical protein
VIEKIADNKAYIEGCWTSYGEVIECRTSRTRAMSIVVRASSSGRKGFLNLGVGRTLRIASSEDGRLGFTDNETKKQLIRIFQTNQR